MVHILRWFIGTLKGQYTARNTSMGSEKKPLNPILGELFLGHWPDKNGRGECQLTTEQVSHHPPITAYLLENKKAGVTLEGHSAQKTTFSGRTIQVKQVGHATLRVKPQVGGGEEEVYLITLPQLVIEGLWYGSPYIELSGASHIASSTGYLATINYSGRGYFSGKAHSFKATVSPISQPTSALYTVEGEWAAKSKFKGKGTDGSGKDGLFWDAETAREEVTVKPIAEQGPLESRKVWEKTAEGIRTGNFDLASKDKSRIEVSRPDRRNCLSIGYSRCHRTPARTSNDRSARTRRPPVRRTSCKSSRTSKKTKNVSTKRLGPHPPSLDADLLCFALQTPSSPPSSRTSLRPRIATSQTPGHRRFLWTCESKQHCTFS